MSESSWQLESGCAVFAAQPLSAELDLSDPSEGVEQLCVDRAPLPDARLLGFECFTGVQASCSALRGSLQECVIRGDSVLASYGETADYPNEVEAAWRATVDAPEPGFLAQLDLILSVHTSRLDSLPALVVRSVLRAAEVFQLVDGEQWVLKPVEAEFSLLPPDVPGCLVFRPAGGGPRYVEMVHPADHVDDEIRIDAGAGLVDVRHRVFVGSLEKGVILRSRIRGAWTAPDCELRQIVAAYESFCTAQPPLGNCPP